MKRIMLLFTVCTLVYSICFATIRRVGYPGIARTNVDYGSLQEANDAANNNDTIQIYGTVSGGTVTKPLVIIGFGYNFDANTGLQAIGINEPSRVDFTFGAGSNGSKVTGIGGYFYVGDLSGNHTLISDITFERCNGYFYFYNYVGYGPASNIKILSSVIQGGGMQWNGPTDFPVTNLQVYNCIINTFTLYKASSSAAFINCAGETYLPSYGYTSYINLNDAGCLIKNCIFYYSQASINVNTVYESNFFAEAQPVATIPGSNNRWSQDWGVIFNRLGGTDDLPGLCINEAFDEDYYTLKPGSPAINGGFNAANQPTDCGIYGGEAAYTYKLSGVPAVPAIYKLTAPSLNASTNPYNVTISVRSNN